MKNINSIFKNSKGSSIIDILFIVLVLLIFGVAIFVVKSSFDGVNDEMVKDTTLPPESITILKEGNTNYTNWADNAFGFIFFGLAISILITSFLIDTHPVFLVISILLFIIVIFVGAVMSNTFEDFTSENDMLALQSDFPITMFIMSKIVILITIIFALMCIVLYGKSQSSTGGGFQ